MSLKQLQQIVTQDSDLNKFQQNVSAALNPVTLNLILDNNQLLNIQLYQGITNQVAHKLNRKGISYSIALYAQADVWQTQAADNKFFYLACSADCQIDMLCW